ncbi:hypothetical protein LZB49_08150, partial [Campylobacter lari]|uniref:hypothetical protein n=1 Tax=Campylobacter lari TaxID=201 RepID=UPI001F09139A
GIKPRSPTLQADSLPSEPPGKPRYLFSLLLEGKEANACKHALETKNAIEMQASSLFMADIILALRTFFPK